MKKLIIIFMYLFIFAMSIAVHFYGKTPPVERIDQKITGVGTNGTIIKDTTIVIYNVPHGDDVEMSNIQLQYIRAFGAYRVPLMMKYILSRYKLSESFVDAAPQFRKQWEERFKTLYAVGSAAWDELAKENFSGKSLYSKIVNPVKEDIVKFYLNSIKYSDDRYRLVREKEAVKFFEENFYITIPQDWENKLGGTNESDIGFLFIVMENKTNKTFSDICFYYDLVENNVMPNEHLRLDYKSVNLNWKMQNGNALTDETLKNARKIPLDKRISLLQPGESVIWLLHAYKSKDNGMPEYYLTDIEIPQKVVFTVNGKTIEQNIRAPYGLKAARMYLPKDWMSMQIWMGQ